MTREWPLPNDGGVTIHAIGDTHFGGANAGDRKGKARLDMTRSPLLPLIECHVQVGDLVDNAWPAYPGTFVQAHQDAAFAWLAGITDAPKHLVIGNHDLWGRNDGDAIAAAYGMPARNYAVQLAGGAVTLLSVNPKQMVNGDNALIYLDASDLAWLNAQANAAPGRVVVACHAPLAETVTHDNGPDGANGYGTNAEPWHVGNRSGVEALLADQPKIDVWLAGHTHHHARDAGMVVGKVYGGHTVAAVNASALHYVGTSLEVTDPLMSAYLTVYESRVEVRYRDHGAAQWFRTPTGALVRSVAI